MTENGEVGKRLFKKNLTITVLVILFFAGIILIYYVMLYNAKRDNIIKNGEMASREAAEDFNSYLSTNIDCIKLAAYALDGMITRGATDAEIQDFLVTQSTAIKSAVIENSTGLYGYINGRFFSGTMWEPPADYVATERPWYTKPMSSPGEITMLDPYIDVQSGNVMLALGKVLCDGVSVISVDVSLDQIQKLTEDAVLSGNSDIEMILNDEGVVVAHSQSTENGKNYSFENSSLGARIYSGIHEDRGNSFEFHYKGAHYVVYTAEIQNGWNFVSVNDATGVFGTLNIILLLTIVLIIAVVIIISLIMRRSRKSADQTVRAVAANEAKSVFLSSMSHEIRTPINAILGMNEMILRESNEKNILTYSGNIKNAGTTLLGIVNDILDFSRIEAGKLEIIPAEYDLAVMLNDLINMISTRAAEKDLEFIADFDPALPSKLYGDERRIKQSVMNILTNAIKYTEKGSVRLYTGFEKAGDDNIILKVSVEDTGSGIKEEDMERLFSEFERIDEARNRHVEGTGLGMSITASLLAMMGSELKVKSEYGKGSVFFFELEQKVIDPEPIGDREQVIKKSHEDKKKYERKFTAPEAQILAVDDNPMNLIVFKSLIKQTLVRIDQVYSGDEAIGMCRDKKYDIIFLDHMMPGKDGIETLQEIKNDASGVNKDTPVICLTANAISGARQFYLGAGFDDHITKPIDPDKLEQVIMERVPQDKIKPVTAGAYQETDEQEEQDLLILDKIKSDAIDTSAGLKNSGGADAYLALLKIFYDSIDDNIEIMDKLYRDNELKDYTIKVHSLKSSARIIGAADFGDRVQLLEDAGKAADNVYLSEHHSHIIEEYRSYKDILKAVFPEKGVSEDDPVASEERMEQAYIDLAEAAEAMDCDRLDQIFSSMEHYRIPEEDKRGFEKIKAAADGFDYGTVISLIGEYKQRVRGE